MSYSWLEHLSKNIGGRLSGSLNTERAIDWVRNELINIGLDSVWLQPVMVPKWVRGSFEYANIESSPGNIINVNICSLGGSIATPKGGIKAKVVEVKNLEELKSIEEKILMEKLFSLTDPWNLVLLTLLKPMREPWISAIVERLKQRNMVQLQSLLDQ